MSTGKIITFYSYKGGTGRTMALANAGAMLARRGVGKVLMIDWDLEAPGLHNFFPELESHQGPGVLELFEGVKADSRSGDRLWEAVRLDDFVVETDEPSLELMKAGRLGDDYGQRVNAFRWDALYEQSPEVFKGFADELAARYDYVLIDSRTGLTDSGGVCTTLLPERLVVVFTPNRQSLTGVVDLVRRTTTYRSESTDLRPLLVFPLASRVEMSEEELRREWRYGQGETPGYQPQFEQLFEDVYELDHCRLEHYFDEIQIQHSTRFAYGERVAVRDEKSDRLSLSRSYERFTRALMDVNGPWAFEKEPEPRADVEKRSERVLQRVESALYYHARQGRKASLRDNVLRLGEAAAGLTALALAVFEWIVYPSNSPSDLTEAVFPIVAVGLLIVGVIEYVRRELAFGNRYVLHARAASALGRERSYFESGAGPYAGEGDPVATLTLRYEEILQDADDALLSPRSRPSDVLRRGSSGE